MRAHIQNIMPQALPAGAEEKQPHSCGKISNLCIVDDYMYAISPDCSKVPQRYNFGKCQWQGFAKESITSDFYNHFTLAEQQYFSRRCMSFMGLICCQIAGGCRMQGYTALIQ